MGTGTDIGELKIILSVKDNFSKAAQKFQATNAKLTKDIAKSTEVLKKNTKGTDSNSKSKKNNAKEKERATAAEKKSTHQTNMNNEALTRSKIKTDSLSASIKKQKMEWDLLPPGLKKVNSALNSVRWTMVNVGFAGLAIVGLVGPFAKFGAEVDNVSRKLSAISGGAMGISEVSAAISGLRAGTPFDFSEMGEGLTEFVKAGFSVEESMTVMPHILDLATGGFATLGDAVTITAQLMHQFNISAEDSGEMIDFLAKAANESATDVTTFGNAMAYVGPVAEQAGWSFEEAGASMMVLANAGLRGTKSGTALRQAISQLVKPTDAATKTMKKYGISFTDLEGNIKGPSQLIKELAVITRSYSTEQAQKALAEIFPNIRGRVAMQALINQYNATGESIDELIAKTTESGYANEVAATQYESATNRMKTSWGDFKNSFKESSTVIIAGLADMVTELNKLLSLSPVELKIKAEWEKNNEFPFPVKSLMERIIGVTKVLSKETVNGMTKTMDLMRGDITTLFRKKPLEIDLFYDLGMPTNALEKQVKARIRDVNDTLKELALEGVGDDIIETIYKEQLGRITTLWETGKEGEAESPIARAITDTRELIELFKESKYYYENSLNIDLTKFLGKQLTEISKMPLSQQLNTLSGIKDMMTDSGENEAADGIQVLIDKLLELRDVADDSNAALDNLKIAKENLAQKGTDYENQIGGYTDYSKYNEMFFGGEGLKKTFEDNAKTELSGFIKTIQNDAKKQDNNLLDSVLAPDISNATVAESKALIEKYVEDLGMTSEGFDKLKPKESFLFDDDMTDKYLKQIDSLKTSKDAIKKWTSAQSYAKEVVAGTKEVLKDQQATLKDLNSSLKEVTSTIKELSSMRFSGETTFLGIIGTEKQANAIEELAKWGVTDLKGFVDNVLAGSEDAWKGVRTEIEKTDDALNSSTDDYDAWKETLNEALKDLVTNSQDLSRDVTGVVKEFKTKLLATSKFADDEAEDSNNEETTRLDILQKAYDAYYGDMHNQVKDYIQNEEDRRIGVGNSVDEIKSKLTEEWLSRDNLTAAIENQNLAIDLTNQLLDIQQSTVDAATEHLDMYNAELLDTKNYLDAAYISLAKFNKETTKTPPSVGGGGGSSSGGSSSSGGLTEDEYAENIRRAKEAKEKYKDGPLPYQDFISRPGQPTASFSPQDTIIGVKDTSNLGSTSVSIGNININGAGNMNEQQLANQIAKEISRELRVR